jgi:hypothetical protein
MAENQACGLKVRVDQVTGLQLEEVATGGGKE